MLRTDSYKRFMMFMMVKSGYGIGATQRESVGLGEVVPELFEADGGVAFPLRP